MEAPVIDYDLVITGISVVSVLIFTLYVLKEFHVEHTGYLLLVLIGESTTFVVLNKYAPQIAALITQSLALAGAAAVGFTGLKHTLFRKKEDPAPPSSEVPKPKDPMTF